MKGAMKRFVLVTMLCSACDVGSVLTASGDASGICENLVTPPGDHHNAGMGCMTSAGCHSTVGTGAAAPAYSYAGTVYRDAAGTQPYPGATILVTLGGTTKKLIAGNLGNFQITPAELAAPTAAATAQTTATVCPAASVMQTKLQAAGDGDCNNCHRPGGMTDRIHIP